MIRTEKAERLRLRPISRGCEPTGALTAPGRRSRRPPAAERAAVAGDHSRGKIGYSLGAREVYGIAVVVRASRSLFSLRRCVSKRSPTLKDVMFWMVLPARL